MEWGIKKCANVVMNNAIPPKNKPKAMGSINQPVNGLYPFFTNDISSRN